MRLVVAVLLGWVVAAGTSAQVPNKLDKRYSVEADQDNFPQRKPKQALESLLHAIQLKKLNYAVAQLVDPAWVDQRVKDIHAGDFQGLVKEIRAHLTDDPEAAKTLRRFVQDGEWTEEGDQATARLKGARDRVFLQKLEGRWFLENRKKAEKPAKDAK